MKVRTSSLLTTLLSNNINMDYTDSYTRLGDHYFKSFNRSLVKIGACILLIILAFSLIHMYQSWLNARYQTKVQKMIDVRKMIAEETHIKNFHAEIVYKN